MKAFLVLATVLENLLSIKLWERQVVAGCVRGRASGRASARDYATWKGRGNFKRAAAAVVGGPVYCGDGDGVMRKVD
jgi:hypothetical protein